MGWINMKKAIAWSVIVLAVLISALVIFLMLDVSIDPLVALVCLVLILIPVASYFLGKILIWAFDVVTGRV